MTFSTAGLRYLKVKSSPIMKIPSEMFSASLWYFSSLSLSFQAMCLRISISAVRRSNPLDSPLSARLRASSASTIPLNTFSRSFTTYPITVVMNGAKSARARYPMPLCPGERNS